MVTEPFEEVSYDEPSDDSFSVSGNLSVSDFSSELFITGNAFLIILLQFCSESLPIRRP